MNPVKLYKCLADETRLTCLLLIDKKGELCVCDLTDALQVSQPKISRHLANLRNNKIVNARKKDQWVFYSINPDLEEWARSVINLTQTSNHQFIKNASNRLPSDNSCC